MQHPPNPPTPQQPPDNAITLPGAEHALLAIAHLKKADESGVRLGGSEATASRCPRHHARARVVISIGHQGPTLGAGLKSQRPMYPGYGPSHHALPRPWPGEDRAVPLAAPRQADSIPRKSALGAYEPPTKPQFNEGVGYLVT